MFQTLILTLLKEAKVCTFTIRCVQPMGTHLIIHMKVIIIPCFYTFGVLPNSYCFPFMLYEEGEVAFFWYKSNYCHAWLIMSCSYSSIMHSGEAPIVKHPYIPMLLLFYLLSNTLQSAFYHCMLPLVSGLLESKMLLMAAIFLGLNVSVSEDRTQSLYLLI